MKNLVSKVEVKNALDLGEINREKLLTFDSTFFVGKSYHGDDGSQNYLIFNCSY